MKIAIAGFGSEGKVSLNYFRAKFPDAEFTIFDEREKLDDAPNFAKTVSEKDNSAKTVSDENNFAKLVSGENAFAKIRDFDLVLRSPSVAPRKIAPENEKFWSATNEFFATCPAPIVGVTGTKGKGTTATMIAEILRAAGENVHLLGNIGVPALEKLAEIRATDVVVFELSSFQLWDAEFSPRVAVVLRIEADHLDVHADFADYVRAKSQIARHQTAADAVIYYEKNQWSRDIANLSAGRKIAYPDDISFDETVLHVPGAHYVEDAKAAIAACRALNPRISDAIIEKGLSNFRAMPHRLELVRELNGVAYYDDNFSASFPSLDVAVKAFPDNPIILIAGGFDRGLNNFAEIAKSIDDSTVKFAILLGQTAPKIAAKLRVEHQICSDLTEAIRAAQRLAKSGDVVVMSPGAPSFDMWRNFYARGDEFQKLVKNLK